MVTVCRDRASDDDDEETVLAVFLLNRDDKILKLRRLIDMVDVSCDGMAAKLVAVGDTAGCPDLQLRCDDDDKSFESMGFLAGHIKVCVDFQPMDPSVVKGGSEFLRDKHCFMWADICKAYFFQNRMQKLSADDEMVWKEQEERQKYHGWLRVHFGFLFQQAAKEQTWWEEWMQDRAKMASRSSDEHIEKICEELCGGNARLQSSSAWRFILVRHHKIYWKRRDPGDFAEGKDVRCCWSCQFNNGCAQFLCGTRGDLPEGETILRDWRYKRVM